MLLGFNELLSHAPQTAQRSNSAHIFPAAFAYFGDINFENGLYTGIAVFPSSTLGNTVPCTLLRQAISVNGEAIQSTKVALCANQIWNRRSVEKLMRWPDC